MRTYRDIFPEDLRKRLPRAFDIVGDICIIKLPDDLISLRRDVGAAILKAYKHVKVVCMDKGVRGEQRVRDVEVIAGENRTETEHRENGCRYRLDVAQVYFSPRLSSERARIVSLVKENEKVWDMFCGAGPFSIPVAKAAREVYASDINGAAVRYLKENMRLNRVSNINTFNGDARFAFKDQKFDRIIMNLPHSAMDFLDCAFERCDYCTIHLYAICDEPHALCNKIEQMIDKREIEKMDVKEVHGYSASEKLFCFDIVVK